MTDFDHDDDMDNETDTSPAMREIRKQLKEQAKALKEHQAQLEAERTRAQMAERKLALKDAGLNLNERQFKALAATHDGDWDVEALKATAGELGFVTPEPSVPSDELASHDRLNNAAAGGNNPAQIDWSAEYANAKTEAEVMAIAQRKGSPTVWDAVPADTTPFTPPPPS